MTPDLLAPTAPDPVWIPPTDEPPTTRETLKRARQRIMQTFATVERAPQLSPDTPLPILSDWAEKHARDYGLHAERNGQGELIITVPARADGLPDWAKFLEVGKAFRGADGWVMEGAEPDPPSFDMNVYDWFVDFLPVSNRNSKVTREVYSHLNSEGTYDTAEEARTDLSRACVEWCRG